MLRREKFGAIIGKILAAPAALLWQDIERSRHLGVQSAFGEFLVRPGVIEPEYGRL